MSIVILHLSDIHIKKPTDLILNKANEIAACTFTSLHSASHIFIVVSGDIAFSGKELEYSLAVDFLNKIYETIKGGTSIPISFIIAPGNHDCDFSLDNGARRTIIKSIEESETPEVDDSVIVTCTSIQKSFFKFREGLEKCREGKREGKDDLLWRTSRFETEGKILAFDCLNISWVSNLHEQQGKLYFPVERYQAKIDEKADIQFLILHHPLNWFNQSIYRPFRTFVRQLADIIISGHEHQGNVGINEDTETEKSVYIEGCVLQSGGSSLADSSFNIVIVNLDQEQFSSTRYQWRKNKYVPTDEGSWSNFRKLPLKPKNAFTISKEFQEKLDDPGAFLKQPSRLSITLTDIYIYPDLWKFDNSENKKKNFISSRELLKPDLIAQGVLIEGQEKIGCTSLLYQLFSQYHSNGFAPLLLNGKSLTKVHELEIDSLIRKEVIHQYGKEHVSDFEQFPVTRKLLLLDDFDDGSLKSTTVQVNLLCSLKKRFGLVVITVNELFEIRELLNADGSNQLSSLEHYQLQPFGYKLRDELIERWFSLANDGTVDEYSFISRCEEARRFMDVVMAKHLIPSIPLYLLVFLQIWEAGRGGDFKGGDLGYYYQSLLSQAFQNAGVKPNKLTEVFQYTNQLAAEFHFKNRGELSETELRDFNTRFSQKWHRVEFQPRVEMLINARVLSRTGDDYAFRYPYIYYYFKGQYLSENFSNLEIREYIDRCCKHLYVRDYANTILFLAHHTNDDFLLNSISEALRQLFPKFSPLTFNKDTFGFSKLIEDAPKLIYTGESPKQYRKKASSLQDDLDDGHDGLADSEEQTTELSFLAQLIMLFKTTEILGQILKNQYSRIQRTRKTDLLEELFNGPLRALKNIYHFFEDNPDVLISEIEASLKKIGKIEKEETRKKIARRVVAEIIQFLECCVLDLPPTRSRVKRSEKRKRTKRKGFFRCKSHWSRPRQLLSNMPRLFETCLRTGVSSITFKIM